MRVGGPYSVTVAKGPTSTAAFEPQTQDEVVINLGVGTDLDFLVPVDRGGSDGHGAVRHDFQLGTHRRLDDDQP